MKIALKLILVAFLCSSLFGQNPPQTSALRTNFPLKVDGILNKEAWKLAPQITGLTEQLPTPRKPENIHGRLHLEVL